MRRPRAVLLAALLASCGRDAPEVVVYTSVDPIYAEQVFAEFTRQTGIRVRPVFDTEETKTLGLVQRLIAERRHPIADVFWSGEAMRTARLAAEGLLEPYRSPAAEDIPARWRDPSGAWTGFAARARVIVYNTERVTEPPRTLDDLVDPRWKGRIAIANPIFGTTAAHAVAIYRERGEAWFAALRANEVVVVGGNSHVRDLVARGQCDAGLTDTDDVWIGIERGDPIAMVYPDPACVIPNTAALVAGAPHAAEAKRFLDFLLAAEREEELSRGRSRQMPVRRLPAEVHPMEIDWAALDRDADRAIEIVDRILRR